MTTNFSIAKWYMDCIDPEGNTFIGYAAILSWGKLVLKYSSQLIYTSENGLIEKNSLRKTEFPQLKNGLLNWNLAYTKTKANWKSLDRAIETKLLESENGNIDWYCAQPKAKAEVLSLNNSLFKGFGYTEKLTMNTKPWELPIDEIRWGRFLSENHSMIWINWTGPKSLNLVYINGILIQDAIVKDFEISSISENIELTLSNSVTLRKGSLISTALSRFPKLKKIFPEKILATFECKWRSAGTLKINKVETGPGWAIHEIVKWN